MSPVSSKSPKHCASNNEGLIRSFINIEEKKKYKKLFCAFSTLITSLISFILLIWLILHPSKPQFSLKEADIYQLNLLDSHLLNSSIQLTLLSNNPNQKVGIYYDQIQLYAAYRGQQITVDTSLPPFYQGHQDSNLLTASLVGTGLPVAPSFGYQVSRDQTAGKLVLNVKVNGKLRWKVGTWVSGRYRINVDCVAVIALLGQPITTAGPLSAKQGTQCSTSL